MTSTALDEITSKFPKKKYRTEKEFQAPYLKFLRDNGCWAFKITDASFSFKPYDAIVVTPDGETWHVELKIADALLTSKDLRPNQHKSLREISER